MTSFGATSDGTAVEKITLTNDALTVSVLTYGGAVQSVRLVGIDHDLTLGSDDLADYEGPMKSYGVIIGPVANRIAGAKTVLDGTELSFEANQDGRHSLHSGSDAAQSQVWTIVDQSETHVMLSLDLCDGVGGFPGNRTLTAVYELNDTSLQLTLTATTDKTTLINLANHSYWNLDGSDTFDGHALRISADHMLPTTQEAVPTGEIKSVENLAYDFRTWVELVPGNIPLDHNFCLTDARRDVTDVATLKGTTGVTMTMSTTEPGLQVYDGRTTGTGHADFQDYAGIALEAQGWPNAMNEPAFPSVTLPAGETYKQITRWTFSAA